MLFSLVLSNSFLSAQELECDGSGDCSNSVLVDCNDFSGCEESDGSESCPSECGDEDQHSEEDHRESPSNSEDHTHHHHHQCMGHGVSLWLISGSGQTLMTFAEHGCEDSSWMELFPPEPPVDLLERPPRA